MENSQPVTPPVSTSGHPWAMKIATVAGIPVYLHFTFLLLLVFFALGSPMNLVFIVALFACVVLHELGHSLMAKRYQIPVSDITLYPIGGIARIEKQPEPAAELWIALAGPAVNVVIALLLGAILVTTGNFVSPTSADLQGAHVWQRILGANVFLALFNLIPAFPMDGGRVLRALLALRMPFERATGVAAQVGQSLALVAGLAAILTGQWGLMLIAVFVYLGAGQEAMIAQRESLVQNVKVREAMITDVRTLPHGATFREAADQLLATSQKDFPVMLGDQVVGLLSRDALLRGLASEGADAYIAQTMERDFPRARPDGDLADLLPQTQTGLGSALVFDGETFLGMVTPENVMEFLVIRQITQAGRRKVQPPTIQGEP